MAALREYLAEFWNIEEQFATILIKAPSQPEAKKVAKKLQKSLMELSILPKSGIKSKVTKYKGWW